MQARATRSQRIGAAADTGEVVSAHARIELTEADGEERTLELGDRLTIGRSSKSDLVIDHLDCSRSHAELQRRDDGRYDLVDLGSRNGCFVNGCRVQGRRALVDGDLIEIAEMELRFVQPKTSPTTQASSAQAAPSERSVSTQAVSTELPAVVLAADVVRYAALARSVAPASLRELVSDWVADAQRMIERARGTFDHMAQRSVIGYWLVDDAEHPEAEIELALGAVRALIGLAEDVAPYFAQRFAGIQFGTAIGLHAGVVRLGNAGATQEQVWSIAGDAVLAAVALQALAEERACPALVSDAIARRAAAAHRFESLGPSELAEAGRPIEALRFALAG